MIYTTDWKFTNVLEKMKTTLLTTKSGIDYAHDFGLKKEYFEMQ